jgi:hypothetical protein
VSVWTQYWPSGGKKAESHWRGMIAEGLAVRWDQSGEQVRRVILAGYDVKAAPEE